MRKSGRPDLRAEAISITRTEQAAGDCFAEFTLGLAEGETRGLAMTLLHKRRAPFGALCQPPVRHVSQCTLDHTFFLVKYIRPENTSRKNSTWKPRRFLASRCGSAAHIMKAATSLEYWSTVCGEPSV